MRHPTSLATCIQSLFLRLFFILSPRRRSANGCISKTSHGHFGIHGKNRTLRVLSVTVSRAGCVSRERTFFCARGMPIGGVFVNTRVERHDDAATAML